MSFRPLSGRKLSGRGIGGTGRGSHSGGGAADTDPRIVLSASSIAENASVNDVIGALSTANKPGDWGTSTYSIVADPDSKFNISGTNLRVGAALNYEAATSHSVTIRDTPSGPYSPIDRVFTITVTNVLEVTLNALTLDADEIEENSAAATVVGAVVGKTSGSTLSLIDDAGGRFALSGNNIIAGLVATNYESATSHNITMRETHPDGNNSPRDSVIAITVTNDVSDDPIEPFMDFDGALGDTANGAIANAATAVALPDNILRLANGVDYASSISASGATVTYDQPGYYRSVSSDSTGLTRLVARLAAGTYTLTVDALSHDETSAYDVFLGTNIGGDTPTGAAVLGVEDSFSHTFVVGSLSNVTLNLLWRNTSGDAYDIRFRNVRLHSGGSDLGVDTPGSHLMFGDSPADTSNPTFSDDTFRQRALILPEGGTKEMENFTVLAAFNQDTDTGGTMAMFFGTAYDVWSVGTQNGRVRARTATGITHPIYGRCLDQGWVTVAWRVSTTEQDLFINSMLVNKSIAAYSAITSAFFRHASPSGLSVGDKIQSMLVYDTALAEADLQFAIDELRSRMVAASFTPAEIPYYVHWVGNSLTDDADSFARRIMTDRPTLIGDWTVVSGQLLSDQVDDIDARLPSYAMAAADGSVPIVSILHGVNDSKVSSDPTGYYADLIAVYADIRANGGKVMACTVPPTSNGGHNTGRATINTLLRNNPDQYDALADFDTTAAGQDDAPGGPYYTDTIHWNSDGYDLITPVVEAALDEIIAQITGGAVAPTADFSVATNSQLVAALMGDF